VSRIRRAILTWGVQDGEGTWHTIVPPTWVEVLSIEGDQAKIRWSETIEPDGETMLFSPKWVCMVPMHELLDHTI